ncbi:MAG: Na/Pi cotransporter family protein, partial [Firmicutes bacterium]|nr:Na/Pi cotransporter family protein [Bacillota bacterium]
LNSLGGSGAEVASYFSTEILTGIVALIGIALWMFSKKNSRKNIGGIMMGFAVLMYGMSMMSSSIAPLREDEGFIRLLTSFSNPILGVLAGLILTAVIQSASAAVGILQALAMTGAVEFDMAFPIIMGIGIGASVPVMLSALGAGTNGKRTAFVYLIIDVLGAIICGSIFYILNAIIDFPFMTQTMNMVSIAFVNTMYRLAIVIMLSPAIGLLEKIVCGIFPEGPEAQAEKEDMDRLETRFLQHPALALAQSKTVIDSMANKSLESVVCAISARQGGGKDVNKVFDLEGMIDRYEDKLGAYLFSITSRDLDDSQSTEVSKYLRVLSDFERISDHARNIGEAVEEIKEKKIAFSGQADSDLRALEKAVNDIAGLTIKAFVDNDVETALMVDPLEEVIDDLCDEIKIRHIERVSRQVCSLENGFVFNDLITDYERISDHCSNISLDVLDSGDEEFLPHEYHMSMDYRQNEVFQKYFEEYKKKYNL